MQFLIDHVSSLLYFAFFLMATIALQHGMTASLNKCRMEIDEQLDMVQTVKILDQDFHKLGYGTSAPNFMVGNVDSMEVKFFSDIDNNGIVDSIHYYLGDVTELSSTDNPNDRILYRKLNSDAATQVIPGVTDFQLSYVDTSGSVIPYANLTTVTGVNNVRAVRVRIKLESAFMMEDSYAGTSWQGSYAPVNLR